MDRGAGVRRMKGVPYGDRDGNIRGDEGAPAGRPEGPGGLRGTPIPRIGETPPSPYSGYSLKSEGGPR